MTRTEEQLTDALQQIARTVHEETLPPLVVPRPERHPWRRRLAPAAAAAAVALIAVLAAVLPGALAKHAADTGPGAGLPRYYVVMQWPDRIVVRATSTGSVVASVPTSGKWRGVVEGVEVAAAGDGRYVAESMESSLVPGQGIAAQIRLYSFRLGQDGRVIGFSLVKGGILAGFQPLRSPPVGTGVALLKGSALDLSPDGTRIALTVCPVAPGSGGSCGAAEIAVVNVRTGEHEFWRGGLNRASQELEIPAISWTSDGRSLVFLGRWCSDVTACKSVAGQPPQAQVRTLDLAAPGRSLAQGRVLLGESARYPDIVQARLVPGSASVALVVLRPPLARPGSQPQDLQVIQVPLDGRGQPRLLYHGRLGEATEVSLSPDTSGQHWLLATNSNGWIGGGRLHLLPPQGGVAWSDVWG